MSRDHDEAPDPRHGRSRSSVPLLLVLLGGFVLALVLAAGAGLFFYRKARNAESIARVKEDEARAAALASEVSASTPSPVGEPRTIDGLTVRMVSAEVGKVRLHSADKKGSPEDDAVSLLVRIEVSAANRAMRFDYRTWRAPVRKLARDDLGNFYDGRLGPFLNEYPGFVSRRSLGFGDRVTDTLAFEPPVEAAKYVEFDLPGENVGVAGTFRFRVAREEWAKK